MSDENTVVFESGRVEVFAPPQNVRVPQSICAAFAFRHEWPTGAEWREGAEHADGEIDLVADAADAEEMAR